jgi:hypothetical protein
MPVPNDAHFKELADMVSSSGLVVLYGAGLNYAQRPAGTQYVPGVDFLPTGRELAEYLADKGDYPDHKKTKLLLQMPGTPECKTCGFVTQALPLLQKRSDLELTRVAQHAAACGNYNFRSDMHELFSREYPVTSMHKTMAALPGVAEGGSHTPPIFITTNYDTVLEHALGMAGHPFDVIYYLEPQGRNSVCMRHWRNAHKYYQALHAANAPAASPVEATIEDLENAITDFTDYGSHGELRLRGPDARTILVKFHGSVAPPPRNYKFESLVLTQDDYISFLRCVPLESPLPSMLLKPMQERDFLFLGYGLGDWNILALCQNLWADRPGKYFRNWAVQKAPSQEEVDRWNNESGNRVELLDMDLSDYAARWCQAMNITP